MIAPYETTLTAIATTAGKAFGFLDDISPALVNWIETNTKEHEGAKEQRIMDRRIRRCTCICRKRKYNGALILIRVAEDFKDLEPTDRSNITTLIKAQLNVV